MPRQPSTLVNPRVAAYARVSSDEQAERQTVEAQRDFLARYVDLHGLDCHEVYVDDGVSGTVPLSDRPAGRRLLADAEAGRFGVVIVYRLDRLARSQRVLLDAHDQLSASDVAIRSATEPFDTALPIGQFLFQLLGSLAELDRATIIERMTLGRDRAARQGKSTGGRIAFGYDVDADGQLVPSSRRLTHGQTEAETAAEIFTRVAAGATLAAEGKRLEALGVPSITRYAGKPDRVGVRWYASRLHQMLSNPLYRGVHEIDSRHGEVRADVPALVTQAVWEAVQAAMTANRDLSSAPGEHPYLLRGVVRCQTILDDGRVCGRTYVGGTGATPRKGGPKVRYYLCTGTRHARDLPADRPRCPGRAVTEAVLDAAVWADVRRWARDPRAHLAEAHASVDDRAAEITTALLERERLAAAIARQTAERERAQVLFRRGLADLDETERAIRAADAEIAQARALLVSLDTEADGLAITRGYLDELAVVLDGLAPLVAAGDAGDHEARRRVIDLLVRDVSLVTELGPPRTRRARLPSKTVRLAIHYRLGPSASGSLQKAQASWKLPDAVRIERALVLVYDARSGYP